MTQADTSHPARKTRTENPAVRKIGLTDLMEAISLGIADFNAMPTHFFYLAIIYPVVTFMIAGFYGDHDMLPFIFPLLAGYTLVGTARRDRHRFPFGRVLALLRRPLRRSTGDRARDVASIPQNRSILI
jgi:hypothetical protein